MPFSLGIFQNNSSELNNVFHHKNQGIPKKDLLVFEKYADDQDVILLFRPVEPLTKTFHEASQYPTKNFKIKGKSASWGLWIGFISINQHFSKLVGANDDVIEKANKEVQDCIQKHNAQSTHLRITEQRFQELIKKAIIFPQAKKEGEYLVIYCPHPHAHEHASKFELSYAKKVNAESGIEYEIYTSEKKPFYVLADTDLKKPLIADYDLLAIFHPWKNYSQDNIRLNPHITPANRLRKLSPKAKRRSNDNPQAFFDREDKELGNVAPITKTHIDGLNIALNKGKYLNRIHHNDDAGSPMSNPEANYPITTIIPPMEGFDSTIFMIENTEQFVNFINKLNAIGYYRIEVNPLWELPIKWAAIRNYFFHKVQIAYCKAIGPENFDKTLMEMFKSIDLSDTTFVKELTNLFRIMTQANFENIVLFERYFDIIQSSLFVNSTLVVKLSRSLEILLKYKALSSENIDRLITMSNTLRNDVQNFYEILTILDIFPNKDANIIQNYFELVENNIYDNKLNIEKFKNDLGEFKNSLETEIHRVTLKC
ncbi:anthrax toxin-like adenylyl cyclase domain-containing protein [Rickettsiella endosymbiont of Aleochara curtula]|uniref:anthrax toxin-like adenylyl cyclase domain-containing protein n=1 Tax=Rickettsiella endosymbiont of Aleochara curtula TaxID=3077936 RepID=UPI00313BBACF